MIQQADPELKAIRRITEILTELSPPARKRVFDFVLARVTDPGAHVAQLKQQAEPPASAAPQSSLPGV